VSVSVPPLGGEQRAEIAKHVQGLGRGRRGSRPGDPTGGSQEDRSHGRGSHRGVQEATDGAAGQ
jgi:hypothetical protein